MALRYGEERGVGARPIGRETLALYSLALFVASAPVACMPGLQFIIPGLPVSALMQLVAAGGVFVVALSRPVGPLDPLTKTAMVVFLLPLVLASLSFFALEAFGGGFFDEEPAALGEYWRRTANLLMQLGLFVFLLDYARKSGADGWWLSKWYYALLVLVVLGGVWQMVSPSLRLPFPAVGVRDQFHGVSLETKLAFGKRLTSFLAEPSYFVAYIGDFAVLSLLFVRSRTALWLALGIACVLVLLSYSFSGVLNMVLLICIATVFYGRYEKASAWSRHSVALGGVLAAVIVEMLFVLLSGDGGVISPYLERFENKIGSGEDIRLQTIGEALGIWLNAGWTTVVFGSGPGMFAMFKYLDVGIPGTSNNMYVDLLVEHGIVGVFMVVLFLGSLMWEFWRRMPGSRRNFVGALLVAQIAISGLYRADFVSARFWVLLFVAVFLLRIGNPERPMGDDGRVDRGATA